MKTEKQTRKRKARCKGAGTLEKRGSIYIARWSVGGRRFSQSTGTASREEAERELERITAPFRIKDEIERLDMFSGKLEGRRGRLRMLEAKSPALKLSEAWDVFATSPERGDTCQGDTLQRQESRFAKFVKWMGEHYPYILEMRQVTREHAKQYMQEIGAEVAPTTYNNILCIFKRVWRMLGDDERAKISPPFPFDRIKPKQGEQVRRREMTVEELTRVCSSLTGEMRTLFAIGIYTGLRFGDCVSLKWECVDMVQRVLSVVPSKTKRHTRQAVTIPIHGVLLSILSETPLAARRGYVLPEMGRKGESPIGRESIIRKIRLHFEACGITTRANATDGMRRRCVVGFHSLRHTFVSMSANAGTPLAVVQKIVGHTNTEMTAHYYHESELALRQAVAALPNVISETRNAQGARGVSPKMQALCELVAGMSEEERREALRIIKAPPAWTNSSEGSTVITTRDSQLM